MKFYFFVEYIENGTHNSDTWSEDVLLDEIRKGEVEIVGVIPSVPHYLGKEYAKKFAHCILEE
jgi:hypothetical protein